MSDVGYLEQIRHLVELQKVDDEIHEVNQARDNAPRALKELERRFKDVEARRAHIQEKLYHLNDQKKRLALELDDDSLKMKKSKTKLMQAGNTREYQAMMREMDSMEKIFHTREEEKSTLVDELNTQNSALEEIEKEYAEIEAQLNASRESLAELLRKADEDLQILNDKRRVASQHIEEPKFRRYEFIRKRLEHPVIVKVEEGICSGCHIAIPPQTFIELQTGQQILSCPNCQRLIFWDRHFETPEEAASREAARLKNMENEPETEDETQTDQADIEEE